MVSQVANACMAVLRGWGEDFCNCLFIIFIFVHILFMYIFLFVFSCISVLILYFTFPMKVMIRFILPSTDTPWQKAEELGLKDKLAMKVGTVMIVMKVDSDLSCC